MSRHSEASGNSGSSSEEKSVVALLLLWLFLGPFGAHRLYAGKYVSGLMIAGLGMASLYTRNLTTGPFWILSGTVGVWLLFDLFTMWSWGTPTGSVRGSYVTH